MALTVEPQSQDYGETSSAPDITVTIRESQGLKINGTANYTTEQGEVLKTDTFVATGKYEYKPRFDDVWSSLPEGSNSIELSVSSYEEVTETPITWSTLGLVKDTYKYTGSSQSPQLKGYDSTKMTISSEGYTATNPGQYTFSIAPKTGYCWSYPYPSAVGKNGRITFVWNIEKAEGYIDIDGQRYREGETCQVTCTSNTTYRYLVNGPNSEFNVYAGSQDIAYIERWYSDPNYIRVKPYANGTVTNCCIYMGETEFYKKTQINFVVYSNLTKTITALPSQKGTLYDNGNYQTPSWNNYNPDELQIGGVIYSNIAGTFNAAFAPQDGYKWWDGTTEWKNVSWTIQPNATPSQSPFFALEPNGITMSANSAQDVTIYCDINYSIKVTSPNPSVAGVYYYNQYFSQYGNWNGQITLGETGEEVTVSASPQGGKFTIIALKSGTVNIKVEAPNYPDLTKYLTVNVI